MLGVSVHACAGVVAEVEPQDGPPVPCGGDLGDHCRDLRDVLEDPGGGPYDGHLGLWGRSTWTEPHCSVLREHGRDALRAVALRRRGVLLNGE